MPDVFSSPPAAGLELGQRAVYGPGYRLACEAASSASGLAITSPAALAAHLGRDLSASAVDDGGWTDLHYAAAFGWPAVARALLVDGAPVNARLKTDAEPLGPQVLDTLRRYGRARLSRLRRTGATPLHIASAADAAEVVAVLLDGGADGDVRESTSATPLHYAAAFDSGSAAAALAAHGADVGAATGKGVTPLHAAARRDALAVARVLLDHGASVRAVDVGGNTPLHRAASGDAAPAAVALLARGAEVDARAHDGMTPLHVAALKDAGRVARVLLDRGAAVGARAGEGVTPLHAAALKDAGEVLTRLLTSGADLEAADAAGQAPLHWAAVGDAAAAVSVLVDQGAHVHGRAADGSTALHAAAFTNAAGAVRTLPLGTCALTNSSRSTNVRTARSTSTPPTCPPARMSAETSAMRRSTRAGPCRPSPQTRRYACQFARLASTSSVGAWTPCAASSAAVDAGALVDAPSAPANVGDTATGLAAGRPHHLPIDSGWRPADGQRREGFKTAAVAARSASSAIIGGACSTRTPLPAR